MSPLKYTNTLATAEARQPATNGYLLRRFTPKIAGSEIPNRVDVNAGIHNSLLFTSFHFGIKYPKTAPPCAHTATEAIGLIKSLPVSTSSCPSIAPNR